MEGTLRKQRQLSLVLRSFAPTRLADEVLAGVYDRLLAHSDRRPAAVSVVVKDEDELAACLLGQFTATGGRYE